LLIIINIGRRSYMWCIIW